MVFRPFAVKYKTAGGGLTGARFVIGPIPTPSKVDIWRGLRDQWTPGLDLYNNG
jgi:hypothetical protein